jgi:hypothetical protein
MLVRLGLPKTLLWVINLLQIFLLMFTFFRLVTYLSFSPPEESIEGLAASFWLGLRFDLRWISLLLLPIVLVSMRPDYSPFYSARNKRLWTWYLALATFFVFFFFAADFGCFSYNKTRLNASALNFAEDPVISLTMLWQSYPLFWMVMALVACVFMFKWMFWKTHLYVISKTDGKGILYHRKWFITSSLLLLFFVYGSISNQPLNGNRRSK